MFSLLPIEGWCLIVLGNDLLGILRQRFRLGQQLKAFDHFRIGLGAHLRPHVSLDLRRGDRVLGREVRLQPLAAADRHSQRRRGR